jgi:hypothetical protein
VPAQSPAENKAVRVVPTSPQPTPTTQTPAVKPEAPAQAATTDPNAPRTIGQGESRKSEAGSNSEEKNKSDSQNKSNVKKKSQTASDQKSRRKDIKRQDSDSTEAGTAEPTAEKFVRMRRKTKRPLRKKPSGKNSGERTPIPTILKSSKASAVP